MNSCDALVISLSLSSCLLLALTTVMALTKRVGYEKDLRLTSYFMLLSVVAACISCVFGSTCQAASKAGAVIGLLFALLDYGVIVSKYFLTIPRWLLRIVDWRFTAVLALLMLLQTASCQAVPGTTAQTTIKPMTGSLHPDSIFKELYENSKMNTCAGTPSEHAFSSNIGAKDALCLGTAWNCIAVVSCEKGVTTGNCGCDTHEEGEYRLYNNFTSQDLENSGKAIESAIGKSRYADICGFGRDPSEKPADCGDEVITKNFVLLGYYPLSKDKTKVGELVTALDTHVKIIQKSAIFNYTLTGKTFGNQLVCSSEYSLSKKMLKLPSQYTTRSALSSFKTFPPSEAEISCVPNPNSTMKFYRDAKGSEGIMAFARSFEVMGWSSPVKKGKRGLRSDDIGYECERNEVKVYSTSDEFMRVEIKLDNGLMRSSQGKREWVFTMPRMQMHQGLKGMISVYPSHDNDREVNIPAECDKVDFCDTFDCYFCTDRLKNWNCILWWQFILLAVGIVVLTVLLSLCSWLIAILIQSCSCIHKNVGKVRGYMRTKSKDIELREVRVREPLVPKAKPIYSVLPYAVLFLLMPMALAQDCSSSFSYSFPSESCESDGTTWKCHDTTFMESVVKSGSEVCYLLRNPDKQSMNVSSFKINKVFSYCDPETLYYTAKPDMDSISSYECFYSGNCEDKYCSEIEKARVNQNIHELSGYTAGRYGRTGCKFSPQQLGCFYQRPGCLYYRYNLWSEGIISDRVIRCSQWTLHAIVEDSNGHEYTVNQGDQLTMSDGSEILLEGLLVQQTPATDWTYLWKVGKKGIWRVEASDRGTPVNGQVGAFQCAYETGDGCIYDQRACEVTDNGGVALVNCNFPKLDYSLPAMELEDCTITPSLGRIEITYHKTVSMKVSFRPVGTIVGPVSVSAKLDHFTFLSMEGAIDSTIPPHINYSCKTKAGGFNGFLRCSFGVKIVCDTDLSYKVAYFRTDVANVNEDCRFEYTDSDGYHSDLIKISGTLHVDDLPDNQGHDQSDESTTSGSNFWKELLGFFSLKWLWIAVIVFSMIIGVLIMLRIFEVFQKKRV